MDKPFACKTQGCGVSFVNEDHLSVHEKKHEMILNLGLDNKSANVYLDQTPTPTRLIKNCEEVGLFDDLKHVNPFDETFRRAVESKQVENSNNDDGTFSSRQTNDLIITNEESLHTPQVFPSLGTTELCEQQQQQPQDFQITKEQEILSENILNENETKTLEKKNNEKSINLKKKKLITDIQHNKKSTNIKRKRQQTQISCDQQSKTQDKIISTRSIFVPNAISIIQPQIITLELPEAAVLPSKPILLPKTTDLTSILNPSPFELSVKEKLKDAINNHKSTSSISNNNNKSLINKNEYYPRRKKDKRNNLIVNSNSTNNNYDTLERRRAAAIRYRRKIKKEQADLKQKNTELIAENQKLRATIKQLKRILANHQNCGITQSSSLADFEDVASNISNGSSSQNIIKSIVQIPTVKFLMNVPRIIVQQQQSNG